MIYSKTLEFTVPTVNINKIKKGIIHELTASEEFKENFIKTVANQVEEFLQIVAIHECPDLEDALEMSQNVYDRFSDNLDDLIHEMPYKTSPYQVALAVAFLVDLKNFIGNIVQYGADFYS